MLNDHWDEMRREGLLSNRLFDLAVAVPAWSLTTYVGCETSSATLS